MWWHRDKRLGVYSAFTVCHIGIEKDSNSLARLCSLSKRARLFWKYIFVISSFYLFERLPIYEALCSILFKG